MLSLILHKAHTDGKLKSYVFYILYSNAKICTSKIVSSLSLISTHPRSHPRRYNFIVFLVAIIYEIIVTKAKIAK